MLYEDVVLRRPRTTQYSPGVGEGHFLNFFLLMYSRLINEMVLVRHVSCRSTRETNFPHQGEFL